MQDLYSGFRKVSEDEKTAVLEHDSGHKLNIAKSGLNKKQVAMLKKLPLYQAKGTGLVEEEVDTDAGQKLQNVGADIADAVAENIVKGVEEKVAAPTLVEPEVSQMEPARDLSSTQQAPVAAAPMAAPASTLEPAPVSAPVPAPVAAAPAPVAPTQKVKTDEDVLRDPNAPLSKKMEIQNNLYMKNLADIQALRLKEREVLPKIEPKRVFNDASLGNKMLMVISAIAGGIGSGLTGRENAALKAMDDAFQRDYEAQKEDRTNKLNLHKFHLESLKDESMARLQVMANYKTIMAAKMEEAEKKYGMGSLQQQRIELERLKIENELGSLNQQIAERKTAGDIRKSMAQPEGLQATVIDPAKYLGQLVTNEKLRERVSKEISRRKTINKSAPLIMEKLGKVFEDYGSVAGQTIGRIKTPESVKDLETEIRGIIPEQEGDVTGQQREAKVLALLNLLKPGPGDIFDKAEYGERLKSWLQQNVSTPAADEAGLNLEIFPATAIRPETWGGGQEIERLDPKTGRIVIYDAKTKKPLRYK